MSRASALLHLVEQGRLAEALRSAVFEPDVHKKRAARVWSGLLVCNTPKGLVEVRLLGGYKDLGDSKQLLSLTATAYPLATGRSKPKRSVLYWDRVEGEDPREVLLDVMENARARQVAAGGAEWRWALSISTPLGAAELMIIGLLTPVQKSMGSPVNLAVTMTTTGIDPYGSSDLIFETTLFEHHSGGHMPGERDLKLKEGRELMRSIGRSLSFTIS